MKYPQTCNDSTGSRFKSAAIAAALSLMVLSACSKDREEAKTAAPANAPPTENASAVAPEEAEQYSAQLQQPARDASIDNDASEAAAMAQFAMIDMATAKIAPTLGNHASGTVHFRPSKDGTSMLVLVELEGLEHGQHGFHIHENGDCSAADAASAGAHFNPNKTHHGGTDTAERHVGDLGNVEANADGTVKSEIVVKDLAFSGPNSILNKALVVHAKSDDLRTDPSGNSGDRVGCGVVYQEPEVLAKPAQPNDAAGSP